MDDKVSMGTFLYWHPFQHKICQKKKKTQLRFHIV